MLLPMDLLYALLFEPSGDLEVADDRCAGPPGDGDRVANMVAVSVADEDEVRFDPFRRNWGGGISRKEGVNNELVSAGLKPESGMSVPGEFDRHESPFHYKSV